MSGQDPVAVGDLNSDAPGSGARRNGGKPDFSLIPLHLLAGTARVLMHGQIVYARWNWAKGMAWSIPFSCIMRHLLRWFFLREDIDPDSGEHHGHHIICNVLMILHYHNAYREGDDRPDGSAMFCSEAAIEDFLKPFGRADQ